MEMIVTKQEYSKKYKEGARAFEDEQNWTDNPYPKGSKENDAWYNGYVDADAQASGDYY